MKRIVRLNSLALNDEERKRNPSLDLQSRSSETIRRSSAQKPSASSLKVKSIFSLTRPMTGSIKHKGNMSNNTTSPGRSSSPQRKAYVPESKDSPANFKKRLLQVKFKDELIPESPISKTFMGSRAKVDHVMINQSKLALRDLRKTLALTAINHTKEDIYNLVQDNKIENKVFHLPTTKKKRYKIKKRDSLLNSEDSIIKPKSRRQESSNDFEVVSTKTIGNSKYQIRRPINSHSTNIIVPNLFYLERKEHLGWGNNSSNTSIHPVANQKFSANKPLIRPKKVAQLDQSEDLHPDIAKLRRKFADYVSLQ